MTDQELLQQAKDQVADEMAGSTWAKIEERFPEALSTHNFMMMHHAAAIRAIQIGSAIAGIRRHEYESGWRDKHKRKPKRGWFASWWEWVYRD